MLSAELDVIGQQVKLSERVKHSRADLPLPQFKPPINITVGPEEEIRFQFGARSFDEPDSLARVLVSYVGGF